ncbi:hypothetical protein I4F81_003328 [Pyropia yezoensis]|uniref:Uncharacterized protein n=1 Tax=Pyropia yezoensis TaxID=2788 RepID=A0ACC3BS47_PYRYE|nr:hypothetical protein I4F81_003328 [Neopyropia yezoensis]
MRSASARRRSDTVTTVCSSGRGTAVCSPETATAFFSLPEAAAQPFGVLSRLGGEGTVPAGFSAGTVGIFSASVRLARVFMGAFLIAIVGLGASRPALACVSDRSTPRPASSELRASTANARCVVSACRQA